MAMAELKPYPEIAIVGPCSSGKSTLREELHAAGYTNVRNPAQEHSHVAHMWRRIRRPDVLIYLDVDYATTLQRRPLQDLGPQRVEKQKQRLANARENADLYINTNSLSPEQIRRRVLSFLEEGFG